MIQRLFILFCLVQALGCGEEQSSSISPAESSQQISSIAVEAEAPAAIQPAQPIELASFESPDNVGRATQGSAVRIENANGHALRISPSGPTQSAVWRFKLGPSYRLDEGSGLALDTRVQPVPEGSGPIVVRLYALDNNDRPIFQRRIEFERVTDDTFGELELPWHRWRWDDRFKGAWSEVAELAIAISTHGDSLDVDNLRLLPKPETDDALGWDAVLQQLAFADAEIVSHRRGDLLIATDAVDAFDQQDAEDWTRRIQHARDWLRGSLPDAVRPTDAGVTIPLLIFQDIPARHAFFGRLGEHWSVSITVSHAGGYCVQDIATSCHDPKLGIDRPVYLHEAVHALIARDFRLQTSKPEHSWVQEGLANYLQLCLYPESLQSNYYPAVFSSPEVAKSAFVSLEVLTANRVPMNRYAQVAALTAYLMDQRVDLFEAIIVGLADGRPISDVLKENGTTIATLEQDWLAWGRQTFGQPFNPPNGPGSHFALPEEFAP